MPYKVCPSCQQTSYSSCINSIWICPYCGKDLTLCKPIYDQRRITAAPTEYTPPHIGGTLHVLPPNNKPHVHGHA